MGRPFLPDRSGKFLMDCAERGSSDDSYDRGKAERWWRRASALCGLESSGTGTD